MKRYLRRRPTLRNLLYSLHGKVDAIMTNQEQLDADVQALNDGLAAVEAEIAALKDQAPETLDFTGLDSAVSRLKADAPPAAPAS